MTTQEILNSNLNKTAKMKQLFALGLTRTEVVVLMGVGYGFVQNVFKAWKLQQGILTTTNPMANYLFDRKFGVEIEAFGVERSKLARRLRELGIEVESETYNHSTRAYWKIINDGSINGVNAFEIVSPPLRGENGLEQLSKVCQALKELKAKINRTCGLHIHFEAENLEFNTWKNLTKNYIKLEPTIDSFMPNSRRENNNNYCKSIIKSDTVINNARNLEGLAKAITNRNRYHKINFESYWRHKTVEFRQHSGTIDFNKISNWISFLAKLIHFSKTGVLQNGTFEAMESILTREEATYFHERIQDLAA